MWASAVTSMCCESPEGFPLPTLTVNKCKMGEGLIQTVLPQGRGGVAKCPRNTFWVFKRGHVRASVSSQYQHQTALPVDTCCYPETLATETLAFSRTKWPRDPCCHPGITQRPLLSARHYPEMFELPRTALPADLCCCPGNTILTDSQRSSHFGLAFFPKVTVKKTAF